MFTLINSALYSKGKKREIQNWENWSKTIFIHGHTGRKPTKLQKKWIYQAVMKYSIYMLFVYTDMAYFWIIATKKSEKVEIK
jgi:hypothetical protein